MSKDIVFRSIRKTDASNVQAVALESWRFTYGTIFGQQFIETFIDKYYAPEAILALFPHIQEGSMFFYVAETEQKVIGFCNIGIQHQNAQLYGIYLLPSFIGQGIGRRLLELGEAFVMERGIGSYFCFVHKDNEIGKRFYFTSGFEHISQKDKEDEWFMEKRLSEINR